MDTQNKSPMTLNEAITVVEDGCYKGEERFHSVEEAKELCRVLGVDLPDKLILHWRNPMDAYDKYGFEYGVNSDTTSGVECSALCSHICEQAGIQPLGYAYRLKRFLSDEVNEQSPEKEASQSKSTVSIPMWLFADQTISSLAKWMYAELLMLRRLLSEPEKNRLLISTRLFFEDIFLRYPSMRSFTDGGHALRELTQAGIISTQDVPNGFWEVSFLREG